MEQKTVSQYAPIKYAFSTFFANIFLYLQIFALVAAGMFITILVKDYLVTTEFIPAGRLGWVSQYIFIYLFKFWFWGACVVIAAKLLQAGHATLVDFIPSARYFPQFVIIQAVFYAPLGVITFLGDVLAPPIGELGGIFIKLGMLVPSFFAFLWILYGQLAIPIFVMENRRIQSSVTASLHKVHSIVWRIIELNIRYRMIFLGLLVVGVGLMYVLAEIPWEDALNSKLLNLVVQVGFEYPFMALSYVYLYDRACRKQHSLP